MFSRRNWSHVLLWAGLLLYLIFAYDLYNLFILRHGKPIRVSAELPEPTNLIYIGIDRFEPTYYDGQYSYVLVGWAFAGLYPGMPPEEYERQVLLTSNERSYFFSIETQPRQDVKDAFQLKELDLIRSGFTALISSQTIAPGVYQVGVSFRNPEDEDGDTYYGITEKYLVRTPNQFYMSDSLP